MSEEVKELHRIISASGRDMLSTYRIQAEDLQAAQSYPTPAKRANRLIFIAAARRRKD